MEACKNKDIQNIVDQVEVFKTLTDAVDGDPLAIVGQPALEMVIRVKKLTDAVDKLKGMFLREANKSFEVIQALAPSEKSFNILNAKVTNYTRPAVWDYAAVAGLKELEQKRDDAIARVVNAQAEARKSQVAKKTDPVINKDKDQLFKVTLTE